MKKLEKEKEEVYKANGGVETNEDVIEAEREYYHAKAEVDFITELVVEVRLAT